jgi:hypothetical protein
MILGNIFFQQTFHFLLHSYANILSKHGALPIQPDTELKPKHTTFKQPPFHEAYHKTSHISHPLGYAKQNFD